MRQHGRYTTRNQYGRYNYIGYPRTTQTTLKDTINYQYILYVCVGAYIHRYNIKWSYECDYTPTAFRRRCVASALACLILISGCGCVEAHMSTWECACGSACMHVCVYFELVCWCDTIAYTTNANSYILPSSETITTEYMSKPLYATQLFDRVILQTCKHNYANATIHFEYAYKCLKYPYVGPSLGYYDSGHFSLIESLVSTTYFLNG